MFRPRPTTARALLVLVGWSLSGWPIGAGAEILTVAVSSNFAPTLKAIASDFESQAGYRLRLSSASTGKLYAQIRNGAPFDLFLAADAERPTQLEQGGFAVKGSRFTYALGRLVLWSGRSGIECERWLEQSADGRLAIANPLHAPYGIAARQALESLGLWERYRSRLVIGENVAQALHFAASRNATAGLVAAAQVGMVDVDGCHWVIPEELHSPIEQQAVILQRAARKPSAAAFAEYLRSEGARDTIRRAGYLATSDH